MNRRAHKTCNPQVNRTNKQPLLWSLVWILVIVVLLPAACGQDSAKPSATSVTETPSEPQSYSQILLTSAGAPQITHEIELRFECLLCHGKRGETDIPYPDSHVGRPQDKCRNCHQMPEAPTPTPTPTQPDTSTAMPLPDSHLGRTGDTCTTCHQPPEAPTPTPTPDPTPDPTPTPSPGEPPPTPVGHSTTGCPLCHENGSAGAPQWPESHVAFTEEMCTTCHG